MRLLYSLKHLYVNSASSNALCVSPSRFRLKYSATFFKLIDFGFSILLASKIWKNTNDILNKSYIFVENGQVIFNSSYSDFKKFMSFITLWPQNIISWSGWLLFLLRVFLIHCSKFSKTSYAMGAFSKSFNDIPWIFSASLENASGLSGLG